MANIMRASFLLGRIHFRLFSKASTIALSEGANVLLILLIHLTRWWRHFVDNLKGLSLVSWRRYGGIRHAIGKSQMIAPWLTQSCVLLAYLILD